MKKLLFFTIASFIGIYSYAQTYNEGDNLLNVGIGLGSTFTTGDNTLPPLSASFEHGFSDKISAGGFLGYAGSKEELATFGTTYTFKYSYLIFGARGSYNFYNTDKIDAYGGVLLGYNVANSEVEVSGAGGGFVTPQAADVGGLAYGFHVGARYYFNEKIGAYGELGYGIAILNIGLAAKF